LRHANNRASVVAAVVAVVAAAVAAVAAVAVVVVVVVVAAAVAVDVAEMGEGEVVADVVGRLVASLPQLHLNHRSPLPF
jgi:hypothetical protein